MCALFDQKARALVPDVFTNWLLVRHQGNEFSIGLGKTCLSSQLSLSGLGGALRLGALNSE